MISILIPAFNPNDILERSLKDLCSVQDTLMEFEIVIVDDFSNEDLSRYEIIDKRIKVIRNTANLGPAASRNVAIRHAKGDIFLFIDSDVVISPEILEKVNNFFKDPQNMALVGNVFIGEHEPKFVVDFLRLQVHYNFNQCKDGYFTSLNTEFGALRREIVDSIGYFNENYKKADVEDFEYGVRINEKYKIHLDNSIEIKHYFNTDLLKSLKNVFRRSFYWMEILSKKKTFENAHVTGKRALSALFSFLFFLMIPNLIFLNLWDNLNMNIPLMLIISTISFLLMHIVLEFKFLSYLNKQRGILFAFRAFLFNLVLMLSIGCGSAVGIIYYNILKRSKSHVSA